MVRRVEVLDGGGQAVRTLHTGYGATQERCFTVDETSRRLILHVNERMDLEWHLGDDRVATDRLIVHTHLHNGVRRIATVSEEAGHEPRIHYYHRDHIHSVCVLSDAAGHIVYSARFAPFGLVLEESGVRPDLLFAGHRAALVDEEGFSQIDMRARRYDPDLGTFISPDPHLDENNVAFGYNRYVYARNCPLTLFDETGLEIQDIAVFVSHAHFVEDEYLLGKNYDDAVKKLAHGAFGENFAWYSSTPEEMVQTVGRQEGKNIKYIIVEGHELQSSYLLKYVDDVAAGHNLESVTNLGCEGLKHNRIITDNPKLKGVKYYSTPFKTRHYIDDETGALVVRYGKANLRRIKLENIKSGKSPFTTDTELDYEGEAIEEVERSSSGSKKTAKKFISKAGRSAMGALNVFGVVSDAGELAESIKRGDVEQTGKKAGSMIAGKVPGGRHRLRGRLFDRRVDQRGHRQLRARQDRRCRRERRPPQSALPHTAKWLGIW